MVTADWEQALRGAWTELALHSPQARRFRTRRLSADLRLDAHAGLRATDGAPCLVIEAAAPADAFFEVSGMRLYPAAGGESPLLVLSLEDPVGIDLFATVCADVLQAAAGAPQVEGLASFLARLHAWRHFLRERRSGLTRNETVGLMGELVVLRSLIRFRMTHACWPSGPPRTTDCMTLSWPGMPSRSNRRLGLRRLCTSQASINSTLRVCEGWTSCTSA